MIEITKMYRDIPIAHRQISHTGHCKFIHGHSWHIKLTIRCLQLDEKTGFVFDFGALKEFKEELNKLDHAMLLAEDDKELREMQQTYLRAFKFYELRNSTCEGVAQHLFYIANHIIQYKSNKRAWLEQIEVWEGDSNSVKFNGEVGTIILEDAKRAANGGN